MQAKAIDSSAQTITFTLLLAPIYGVAALASVYFNYLGGGSADILMWIPLAWGYTAVQAITLGYLYKLHNTPQGGRVALFLTLVLAPAIIQCGQDLTYFYARRSSERAAVEPILVLLFTLEITLLAVGAVLARSGYLARVASLKQPDAVPEVTKPDVSAGAPHQTAADVEPVPHTSQLALGNGGGYVDRVIRSVLGRAVKSERMATFSLTIMLILVMLGALASFGLWAFTHGERINSLEAERSKLLRTQAELRDLQGKLASGDEGLKYQLDLLLKPIDQNYQTSASYEETLKRLSEQSQTNVADIAIRVTIAVLTIFLVQVLFSVYKYNRHLAIMLAAKAEALELAGNDEEARKILSREAVNIVKESVPGFGPSPRTIIGEAAQAAEKLKGGK